MIELSTIVDFYLLLTYSSWALVTLVANIYTHFKIFNICRTIFVSLAFMILALFDDRESDSSFVGYIL